MAEPAQTTLAPECDSAPLTALIVEDNPGDALLIRTMLYDGGDGDYEVLVADRLARALDYVIAGHKIHVVLLDLSLPDSTGIDTFLTFYRHSADIPIIVLTGFNDRRLALNAIKEGAQDYMVKGEVDGNLLARSINYAVERKKSERQIRFQASLLDQVQNAVIATDTNAAIRYWNRFAEALFGWSAADAIGSDIVDLLTPVGSRDLTRELFSSVRKSHVWDGELTAQARDGRQFPIALTVSQTRDERGRGSGFVCISVDISERKRVEEKLQHDACHDALTNLPNRTLLMDRLCRAIARNRRNAWKFAVMVLDLDRFKVVNDSLGHHMGDELLVQFARRVHECLRPGDTLARLGGDEFSILLEDIADTAAALRIAERIQHVLSTPFELDEHEVFITASIGIALDTLLYEDATAVIRDADTAMYRAKSQGKACHVVFDTEMHQKALTQLKLETELRRAVERGEFVPYYQPIVSMNDGRLLGCEALVRWRHPSGRDIPPGEFIALAEDTGLILPIGAQVLEQSCCQIKQWQDRFPLPSEFAVHVNLSTKQFCQRGLVDQVRHVLGSLNLAGDALILEITESVLMQHTVFATAMMRELREVDVHFCLDDFGTGYSSLSYLHRFPVDVVKIDRSFVQGLNGNGPSRAIVQAVIGLGQALGMKVIAEGIETEEHRSELVALGCDTAQGFYFHKPVPADAMDDLLQKGSMANPGTI
ncbi:MAG TPA: EAL domain-containing protein [Pseudomonadales bacterium]|nr:EAL domain-containing protein [Pseudomonadales bacterium]